MDNIESRGAAELPAPAAAILTAPPPPAPHPPGAWIVAFMNQKGGVGKTTTVASVGGLLAAERGRRVLLVDLDSQCNLTEHFGVNAAEADATVFDVLIDGADPASAIVTRHGLDLLPASPDLSGADILMAAMERREGRLRDALARLAGRYDEIFLDCPPSLGLLTISGLTASHGVVIPMQAEFLALRGLAQLMRTVQVVRERLNPALSVDGLVFCMYNPQTHLARDVRAEAERHFPGQVCPASVRRNVRLAEAPSHGLPIHLYDPTSTGAADYREVAAWLEGRRPGDGHRLSPASLAAMAEGESSDGFTRKPVWRGDLPQEDGAAEPAPEAPGP